MLAFLIIVGAFLFDVASLFWASFVLHQIWVWHFASLHAALPVQSIAIMRIAWFVFAGKPAAKAQKGDEVDNLLRSLGFGSLAPAFALLVAWILY